MTEPIKLNPDWQKTLPYASFWVRSVSDWVKSLPDRSFYELWDSVIDPKWLLYMGSAGGASHRQIVTAVCNVARLCLSAVPDRADIREALEMAESWCLGTVTAQQVEVARLKIYDVIQTYTHKYATVDAEQYSYHAAMAVSYACLVVSYVDVSFRITYASEVVESAIRAGVWSKPICEEIRKGLPFEAPKEARTSFWRRLVSQE